MNLWFVKMSNQGNMSCTLGTHELKCLRVKRTRADYKQVVEAASDTHVNTDAEIGVAVEPRLLLRYDCDREEDDSECEEGQQQLDKENTSEY